MEGKFKGGSTSKAIVMEGNCETNEYTDKIPIKKVIADENETEYH